MSVNKAALEDWANQVAGAVGPERVWGGLKAANPVRPAVLVRGADEIVALAKELKRLGVKHFKDDSMELSFEREMKRPERPEGEF